LCRAFRPLVLHSPGSGFCRFWYCCIFSLSRLPLPVHLWSYISTSPLTDFAGIALAGGAALQYHFYYPRHGGGLIFLFWQAVNGITFPPPFLRVSIKVPPWLPAAQPVACSPGNLLFCASRRRPRRHMHFSLLFAPISSFFAQTLMFLHTCLTFGSAWIAV